MLLQEEEEKKKKMKYVLVKVCCVGDGGRHLLYGRVASIGAIINFEL